VIVPLSVAIAIEYMLHYSVLARPYKSQAVGFFKVSVVDASHIDFGFEPIKAMQLAFITALTS